MYKKTANTYISSEFPIPAQNSKQVGVAIRFVARFGRSKLVRALGMVSSGVKEREANRSDVEKERFDTRRDRSGALGGSKRTPPICLITASPLQRSASHPVWTNVKRCSFASRYWFPDLQWLELYVGFLIPRHIVDYMFINRKCKHDEKCGNKVT